MTRDDIIRMAIEAGGCTPEWDDFWELHEDALVRFAALVAAAEREAWVKVCCDIIDAEYKTGKVDHNEMAWTQACATASRARGET